MRKWAVLPLTCALAVLVSFALVFWLMSMSRIGGQRPSAQETWELTVERLEQAAALDEELIVWGSALLLGWSVAVFLVGTLGDFPLRPKLIQLGLGIAYAVVAVIVGGLARNWFHGSGEDAFHLAYTVVSIALYGALFARRQAAMLRAAARSRRG